VVVVGTDVSKDGVASIFRVERISGLGTLVVNSIAVLLVTADVPSSLILFTLMMETICYSETSVLTRATQCHIPEHGILHSNRSENLKSYMTLTGSAL
jgi:hypothetical protein